MVQLWIEMNFSAFESFWDNNFAKKKLRFFAKNLILIIEGLVRTYWHFRPSIELTDLLLIVEMAAGGVRKVEGGDPAGGRVVVL